MQDFVIITNTKRIDFIEKIKDLLNEGYSVISSGQYDRLVNHEISYWAHLVKT